MNSRVTMGLAGLLLLGAIFVGYWGLVLSRQPAPVAAPVAPPTAVVSVEKTVAIAEDQTRQPVVVLTHDVPPFTPLTAADLTLEKLRSAPAGSLGSLDQAIGRTPWRHLSAGTWLSDESFEAGGTLSRMIRSNERALAVAVDEVIGAAGQLTPGDYVDVLLFLRQDASNLQQSAQIVVPAMRVLGVGDQYGLTNDGQPATPALSADDKLKQDQRRAKYWAGENETPGKLDSANSQLFQFTQLALGGAPKGPASGSHAGAARPAIEVIRGNQLTQQTP